MKNPGTPESASAHEAERRRFYSRLFRWGIVFWVLAWIFSILVSQCLVVNLKGWRGMRFNVAQGSISVMFNSYRTVAFNFIQLEKPSFRWSERHLRHLRKYPEDYLGALGRVGWSGYGFEHTIAFPVAGFLWLWLIGGWLGDIKRTRRAEFVRNGRMIGRLTILVSLPLFIALADHRGRIAYKAGVCLLNVRNIQQAIRAHAGVRGLLEGAPLDWSEVIGLGKYLGSHAKECPCGQSYRLVSRMPALGELAAECPNQEHQKRIKEHNTSDW